MLASACAVGGLRFSCDVRDPFPRLSILSRPPCWGGHLGAADRRDHTLTDSRVAAKRNNRRKASIDSGVYLVIVAALHRLQESKQRQGDTAQAAVLMVAQVDTAAFLIAFLLQNSQDRDTRALQLKLDELIRSTAGARSQLIQLEELDDDQLDALKHEFERLHERRSRTKCVSFSPVVRRSSNS
jgi:low affinity Fe/Cu permease